MKRLFLIVGGLELALFIATRLIISHWSAWEWQPELLRTAGRAGVAFALWYFFRTIIFSAVPNDEAVRRPSFLAALAVLFSVPLLVGNWAFMGPGTKAVFAATSVVVAIHEEFLFRGIVQTVIARRWGTVNAVAITSVAMTAWHVGALPFNFFSFWQVLTVSCILGLIFAASGSIWLAVAVHALYDAIWSLTPILATPLSWQWGAVLLLVSLLLTGFWVRSNMPDRAIA